MPSTHPHSLVHKLQSASGILLADDDDDDPNKQRIRNKSMMMININNSKTHYNTGHDNASTSASARLVDEMDGWVDLYKDRLID